MLNIFKELLYLLACVYIFLHKFKFGIFHITVKSVDFQKSSERNKEQMDKD